MFKKGHRTVPFLTQMSSLCHKLQEYASARKFFLMSLNGAKPNAVQWKILGELYKDEGDLRHAAFAWRNSLELNPHQAELKDLFDLYSRVTGGDIADSLED